MEITSDFFKTDTITLSKKLLGCYLKHTSPEGITIGRIVETEGYISNDPANHAFRGMTSRTRVMYGEPGHAYIYFTYGMYYCFNITSGEKGVGEGVLIRALEPIEGIPLMQQRRQKENIRDLCSGPAKLVIAMGIKPEQYGHDMTQEPLILLSPDYYQAEQQNILEKDIVTTTRIGVSQGREMPLRFYIKNCPFISKK
jgi:DNA-3-methyladenine glycosylase